MQRMPMDEKIRIHTVFDSSITGKEFAKEKKAIEKAVSFFSNAFLVKRRTSVLRYVPICGSFREGKCTCAKRESNANCGPFVVPDNLKGSIEECLLNELTMTYTCKKIGSDGAGVDADYILFAGAVEC